MEISFQNLPSLQSPDNHLCSSSLQYVQLNFFEIFRCYLPNKIILLSENFDLAPKFAAHVSKRARKTAFAALLATQEGSHIEKFQNSLHQVS